MFNQEFEDLVNYAVEKEKELSENLKNILTKSDYKERKKYWENIETINESYAHPYYIGFGNPDSDILIIGKEKAFEVDDKELLFSESINNVYYWKLIIDGKLSSMPGNNIDDKILEFAKEYGFCPMFPLAIDIYKERYLKAFIDGGTWKKCEKLINFLYGNNLKYDKNSKSYSKSFFSHCFLTELNYIPSKQTKGDLSCEYLSLRLDFLSKDFFKRFKIILFTAYAYIKDSGNVKANLIYNLGFNECFYKRDLSRNIREVYLNESDRKILVFTNQLSGSCGWSNDEFKTLSDIVQY